MSIPVLHALPRQAAAALGRLFPPLGLLPSPSPELAQLSLRQVRAEHRFALHLVGSASICLMLISANFLIDGGDEPWSLIFTGMWAFLVAAHGWSSLVRRRRRVARQHADRRRQGSGAEPGEVAALRARLLSAAEEARSALRAAGPEMVAEVSRGESEALTVVAWLDDAERLLAHHRGDGLLRREVAHKLSRPGGAAAEQHALEGLLVQLDLHDGKLAALEREAARRRATVESFLLAIENVKLARSGGDIAPAVRAPIHERVALLEGAAPGAALLPAAPGEQAADAADEARIRHEVRLAQDLQRSILPTEAPAVAGLEVAHLYRPSSEVGGDFYDFYTTGEHRLLVALGDASGHGLDSSMVSSMAKSALYMQVSAGRGLAEAMAEINRMMCDTLGRRRLMTLTLVELDTRQRTVSWVNAGQVFPLLRRGGEVRELAQPGYPLGVRRQMRYRVESQDLEAGDRLLLLTDGYVEAADAAGEPYGWERLTARLRGDSDGDPDRLLAALDEGLGGYLDNASPQDDVTLIAIRFEP